MGVVDQVQDHLLELERVGDGHGEGWIEVEGDGDIIHPQLIGAQVERVADHLVEIDHQALGFVFAREHQQILYDPGSTFGLGMDLLQILAYPFGQAGIAQQQLGIARDAGEWIVELMRDAGDKLADRGELFGMQELLFEAAALGQIARNTMDLAGPRTVAHQARAHFEKHAFAIVAPEL